MESRGDIITTLFKISSCTQRNKVSTQKMVGAVKISSSINDKFNMFQLAD